jgi:hypothetical protein
MPEPGPPAWSSTSQIRISTSTPHSPTSTASHCCRETRSPSSQTESGISQNTVTLARMAVRPAGTQASARCVRAKKAPSCSRPMPMMQGRSPRSGQRSRRIAASSRAEAMAASPARFTANQSGVACASAALVTGQMPPNRQTETAR